MTRYSLVLVFLTACGQLNVDHAFSPYVERFESVTGAKNDTPISFDNLTYPTIGTCTSYDGGFKYVKVSPSYWSAATDDQKEYLIFHELGHCVLRAKHIDKFVDGCPISIMSKFAFGDTNCYRTRKQYYFNELKSYVKFRLPFFKESLLNDEGIESE